MFDPAPSHLKALALAGSLLLAASALAQSTVNVTTNYYPVTGTAMRDVLHSLRTSRPFPTNFPYFARTEWKLRWSYVPQRTDDGYSVQQFSTEVRATVTMPRWNPPPDAVPETVQRWKRFTQALAVHEEGHVNIARQAAEELRRQIMELQPEQSRGALGTSIHRVGNKVLDAYRQKERDYDRDTGHGARQGARF